jgi:hypothetical protein
MAADDDFVFVPPRKVFADDLLVDDVGPGGLGRNVPFWKVLLWRTAQARARIQAVARADGAKVTPVRDEDKPPRLAADAKPDPEEAQRREAQMNDFLTKLDEFEQRMSVLEARKRANDALLALEAAEAAEENRTLN